jgi:hypothetical protein
VSPDGIVRPTGRARPARRQGSGLPFAILHETATRLRVRLAIGSDLAHARVALETLDGVRSVRISPSTRSIAFDYDGRSSTREAVLERLAAPVPTDAVASLPRRDGASFPLEVPLVAASLAPLLPAPARSAVALALVAGRSLSALRNGGDVAATALDAVSLATAALTGHPLTAVASVAMGAFAEQRRDAMLRETDRLLAQLAPASARSYDVERAGEPLDVAADDVQTGDEAWLDIGAVVPADGIVISGQADVLPPLLAAATNRRIRRGARVESGTTVRAGRIRIRFERPLTPDLERLVALPVTAAGLLLALTGDAARTATMLQADPQTGIALAQPVAREAALYATARSGALLSGLESLDRLATATSFAFEDVGVLADARWYVERVMPHAGAADPAAARHWLALLAGYRDDRLIDAGLPDDRVAAWREHGALLRLPDRTLHIGGAVLVARTWGLPMPEPDRRSLVRRLGIVEGGRLLATVHLGCRLRPRAMAHLAELRALGVGRIAVFTEDPTAQPALALTRLGADDVVSHDRRSQERWLDEAVEQGERVALVHTGLRDLLPPGGLSLCPVDADAGAHGVLLGDPLASLVSARRAAMTVRRALRRRFGRSVTLNAGLMIAAAMRWLPPIAIASIKHGLNVLLLEESAGLARLEAPSHGANVSNLREGKVS